MAPEGRIPLLIGIVTVGGLNWWLGIPATPLWLVPVLLLWVYRDPVRVIPPAPLGVISPIDGEVTDIDTLPDGYLKRQATRVRIKPSLLDSFVIHSVSEGKVMQYWRGTGDDSVEDKYRRAVWLQTDEGDDIVVAMQARPTHPLHCRVSTGERIGQGHDCGFLLFARYVDVLLPVDSRIDIKEGDRLRGGESIIAQLIHR